MYITVTDTISSRDETILQYIDILQYLFQQYNTIWLKGNINILHIAIYCDILQYIAMFIVNAQSLHHKNDWTSRNLDYTLEFFYALYSYSYRVYILFFTAKTHIPI